MNAEQYARDSFSLLNQRASELGVSVENRYRVTDKLVQEMIQLIRKEQPYMLLLGAGNRYKPETMSIGTFSWLSLFRDKVDEVMTQVPCTVAVLIDRNYREDLSIGFVLGGIMDQFLFPYIEQIVASGRKVNLFLFEAADEEFALQAEQLLSRHVGWLTVQPFTQVQQLIPQNAESELLVMSHTVYTQLYEDESLWEQLPSMLVIRENKNGLEKDTL